MTSRYRVEYALKSHRRDEFIEWIKALLACPFVLHADVESFDLEFPELYDVPDDLDTFFKEHEEATARDCKRRYLEIFRDVETLIEHTILIDEINDKNPERKISSRLRNLVPSIGKFFTKLPLQEAFLLEDERRGISKRRLVSPSFNDVRMILNTAQIMALTGKNRESSRTHLKLVTFDGDVTLYDDGESLTEGCDVVKRLVGLLHRGLYVGVVTAAGYPGQSGAVKYYERLKGLIDYLNSEDCILTDRHKENLLVMGAESNYLFRYSNQLKGLKFIDSEEWLLPAVRKWDTDRITYIVHTVHHHLIHLRQKFQLEETTTIIKKERSVGIMPNPGCSILREQLEELVLSCSRKLYVILNGSRDKNGKLDESLSSLSDIKVCAFNGGSDVWVDIGDKALGVESLQKYLCQNETHDLCPIRKSESLHVGDQFASLGANDFKARLSACTVWIANPRETVAILDGILNFIDEKDIEVSTDNN
ncbi:ISN1 [Candida oxycetoniae]|uniref:IMP-specific 5'-nucleotidase 1 n=1 Tax=Candida oxycetoniae TaxID=497107 RepID=A0AAI9SX94_9ASCO|nr:ISN1 [Candida oxycetoniae]KAI3404683.1 ISN1 [Candida oxycetoniae]